MSSIKVIFTISLVIWAVCVQCEEIVPGIPVRESLGRLSQFSSRLTRADTADATCGTTFGPKCKNCNTLMNCLGKDPPASTFSCADKDPKKPYCEGTVCSATTSDSTCKPQTNFQCTDVGYFPDPNKCNRYYICSGGVDKTPTAYECPQGYVYKSKQRGCAKQVNAADCTVVDCSKTPNEFAVYTKDPAYFYYCQKDDTGSETIMLKCPDENSMQFDPKLGYCTFQCPAEGNFVNVEDHKKYYFCYKVGTAFQVQLLSCPDGFCFDATTKVCALLSPTASSCGPNKPEPEPPGTDSKKSNVEDS